MQIILFVFFLLFSFTFVFCFTPFPFPAFSLSYMKTTANIFQSLFSFCYCLWKFFSVYIFIIWPNLQLFYTICFHYFFFVEKLSLPSNQENIPCSFFFQVYMMFVLLCFFDCFSSLIGLEYNLGMV